MFLSFAFFFLSSATSVFLCISLLSSNHSLDFLLYCICSHLFKNACTEYYSSIFCRHLCIGNSVSSDYFRILKNLKLKAGYLKLSFIYFDANFMKFHILVLDLKLH